MSSDPHARGHRGPIQRIAALPFPKLALPTALPGVSVHFIPFLRRFRVETSVLSN